MMMPKINSATIVLANPSDVEMRAVPAKSSKAGTQTRLSEGIEDYAQARIINVAL